MDLKTQLKNYLLAHNTKPYLFAKKIGIANSIIYEFLKDKRDIRLSVAKKIERGMEE